MQMSGNAKTQNTHTQTGVNVYINLDVLDLNALVLNAKNHMMKGIARKWTARILGALDILELDVFLKLKGVIRLKTAVTEVTKMDVPVLQKP